MPFEPFDCYVSVDVNRTDAVRACTPTAAAAPPPKPDTRRVEVASGTGDRPRSAGGQVIGTDERLVSTLVAYKDAVDSRSLLPITFV